MWMMEDNNSQVDEQPFVKKIGLVKHIQCVQDKEGHYEDLGNSCNLRKVA